MYESGLITVDLESPPELDMAGAYRLPAPLLARLTDRLYSLLEVFEPFQLDAAGERLFVTRLEGGVAAIDTTLEPPKWLPSPVGERVGR